VLRFVLLCGVLGTVDSAVAVAVAVVRRILLLGTCHNPSHLPICNRFSCSR
jgi:hypothetical protein